jgi:hypothetical protein
MSRIRFLAVFSAVVVLAGCYSYRATSLTTVEPKHHVRVTTSDGRRIEMARVTIASDTVRGMSVRQRLLGERLVSVAVPVADLMKVEVRRVNVVRSIALVGTFAALVAIPVFVIDWGGIGGISTSPVEYSRRARVTPLRIH